MKKIQKSTSEEEEKQIVTKLKKINNKKKTQTLNQTNLKLSNCDKTQIAT